LIIYLLKHVIKQQFTVKELDFTGVGEIAK